MSDPTHRKLSRRKFLQNGAYVTGAVALTATTIAVTRRLARPKPPEGNPFAYKTDHLSKTDPKWLHYDQIGRFPSPRPDGRRIVCGTDERLYVAAGNYISVLDLNGALLNEIALSETARCVAVGNDGLIYAGLRKHIEVFDGKGQRKSVWESPAQRTWFTGLTVGETDLFACDAGNRIVLRYDQSGKLKGRIGERNAERNIPGFKVPSPFFDVKLAPDGLVRVTNPGHHRIETYTADGQLEFSWGKSSAHLDGFCGCCNPVNLALLNDGRHVTCEKGLPRVKIYSADGTLESVVAGPESFAENTRACEDGDCTRGGLDAAVDTRGRIYILDLVRNEVCVMQRKAGLA